MGSPNSAGSGRSGVGVGQNIRSLPHCLKRPNSDDWHPNCFFGLYHWPIEFLGCWKNRASRSLVPERYLESEQAVHRDAQDTQGSLVLQSFGRLVEFLQGELGILVEAVVIDQFPGRALTLIDLLENLLEI